MKQELIKNYRLARRKRRVRRKVTGAAGRPRLAVTRTLKNIAAQIIDDAAGKTLCAVSTVQEGVRGQVKSGCNAAAAKLVGKLLGEQARGLGIERVCFDRRGRRYHGRIKALAEAAREAGLKF